MKKYRKLDLRKFKVANLATTSIMKGGILTNDLSCEPNTIGSITIGVTSCLNDVCNNLTHEFNTCRHQGTIETRTSDSLGDYSINNM
jgi:hypothetical protein